MLEKLIAALACPLCKSDLKMEDGYILCSGCSKKFPIKNGIPVLLEEEAI